MYKNRSFRVRPHQEVVEDLDLAVSKPMAPTACELSSWPTATARCSLPADWWQSVRSRVSGSHPSNESPSTARPNTWSKKTQLEWRRIAEAGITRIHSGLESGDAVTLADIDKGVTPEEAVAAYRHVKDAGIELSVYLMVWV